MSTTKEPKREPQKYEGASLSILFIFATLVAFAIQIAVNPLSPWYARAYTSGLCLYVACWILKHDFDSMIKRRLFIESFIYPEPDSEVRKNE